MSQYLVRWKFGPNSLLNSLDIDTAWYMQFHPNKDKAVEHYTSTLYNAMPSMAITVELFQLVQLVPGQPEPEDIVEEVEEKETDNVERASRDQKIMKMYKKGYSRREIANELGVTYQTVYGVIRKLTYVEPS